MNSKSVTYKENEAIGIINDKFLQCSAEMEDFGADCFEISYYDFAEVFYAMSEESVKEYAKRVRDYFDEDLCLLETVDGYDPDDSEEPHIFSKQIGNKIIYQKYVIEAKAVFGYEFWKDNSILFPDEYPGVDTGESFAWDKTKHNI